MRRHRGGCQVNYLEIRGITRCLELAESGEVGQPYSRENLRPHLEIMRQAIPLAPRADREAASKPGGGAVRGGAAQLQAREQVRRGCGRRRHGLDDAWQISFAAMAEATATYNDQHESLTMFSTFACSSIRHALSGPEWR